MVADSRKYVTGKYLEILGSYVPKAGVQEESVSLDMTKVQEWIKKGALATDRVKHVIKLAEKTK
jgi:small subunit ribosomal protein S16